MTNDQNKNEAFEKWHGNSYLGKTLHPHNDRIVSLVKSAFEAGQRQMNERCADLLLDECEKLDRERIGKPHSPIDTVALRRMERSIRKEIS